MNIENITLGYLFNLVSFFFPGVVTLVFRNINYYRIYRNIKLKISIFEIFLYTFSNYFILEVIWKIKIYIGVENYVLNIILTIIWLLFYGILFLKKKKNKNIKIKYIRIIFWIIVFLTLLVIINNFDKHKIFKLIDIKSVYSFENVLLVTNSFILAATIGMVLRLFYSKVPIFFPARDLLKKRLTKCEIIDKSSNKKYIGFLSEIIYDENVNLLINLNGREKIFLELKKTDLIIRSLGEVKYVWIDI